MASLDEICAALGALGVRFKRSYHCVYIQDRYRVSFGAGYWQVTDESNRGESVARFRGIAELDAILLDIERDPFDEPEEDDRPEMTEAEIRRILG